MQALDRRGVLRLSLGLCAAAALLPGCAADEPAASGTAASPPVEQETSAAEQESSADPGDQVRSEAELVALYDAVIAANPALAAELGPIRDQHMEHAAALGTPQLPSVPSPAQVPRGSAALALLVRQERAAAQSRAAACGQAQDAALARTLALISASEAAHAVALNRGP